MTQDVLLTISGLHDMAFADPEENEENEPIEVITPASYYWKNGKHYILYDEVMEGIPGVVKNKIKITGEDSMEIMKSGITNAHMVFEKKTKRVNDSISSESFTLFCYLFRSLAQNPFFLGGVSREPLTPFTAVM